MFPRETVYFHITSFQRHAICRTRCCSNQSNETKKKRIFKSLIGNTSQSSHNCFINWFSHQQGRWGGGNSYLRSHEPFPDKIYWQRFNTQIWKCWPHEQRLYEEVLLLSLCTMASWTKYLDVSHPVFLHYSPISVPFFILTKYFHFRSDG